MFSLAAYRNRSAARCIDKASSEDQARLRVAKLLVGELHARRSKDDNMNVVAATFARVRPLLERYGASADQAFEQFKLKLEPSDTSFKAQMALVQRRTRTKLIVGLAAAAIVGVAVGALLAAGLPTFGAAALPLIPALTFGLSSFTIVNSCNILLCDIATRRAAQRIKQDLAHEVTGLPKPPRRGSHVSSNTFDAGWYMNPANPGGPVGMMNTHIQMG